MFDLLNRQAKALAAVAFTSAAVAIETNAPGFVEDVSAWVTGTLLAGAAYAATWLKANGPAES